MSYKKMMKWNRRHRKGIRQLFHGFSPLGEHERRRTPWLGGAWYEPGMGEEREAFIKAWKEETERMIAEYERKGMKLIIIE